MSTKVKGLLRGLRYISQIFDNEKEQEMEIGYPTDVKHVAHIGADGPSSSSPTWMNEFQGSSEPSSGVPNDNGETKDNLTTASSAKGAPMDSPTRRSSGKNKQSRRHNTSNGSIGSPARDSSGSSKPRRHKNVNPDSPTRESSHRHRRIQNSSLGSETPSQDPTEAPKSSRRKKSKGSSRGGSTRSTQSEGPDPSTENFPYSDPGSGYGRKSNEMCSNSALEAFEEGKECEEITRGVRAL